MLLRYKYLTVGLQLFSALLIAGPVVWDIFGFGGHTPGIVDIRVFGWCIIALGVILWFVNFVLILTKVEDKVLISTTASTPTATVSASDIGSRRNSETVDDIYQCPFCYAKVNPHDKFCNTCNKPFETIIYECPNCNSSVGAEAKVCTNCGSEFE